MRPAGLALERAPPIAVPFRFFLTAPLFLFAAGGGAVWSGPEALTWRGSPAALAATHFVTLGFMTMVMAGAMLQMLPVLAGAPVPHAELRPRSSMPGSRSAQPHSAAGSCSDGRCCSSSPPGCLAPRWRCS